MYCITNVLVYYKYFRITFFFLDSVSGHGPNQTYMFFWPLPLMLACMSAPTWKEKKKKYPEWAEEIKGGVTYCDGQHVLLWVPWPAQV